MLTAHAELQLPLLIEICFQEFSTLHAEANSLLRFLTFANKSPGKDSRPIKIIGDFLIISLLLIVTRLRIFMQIYSFTNLIEEIEFYTWNCLTCWVLCHALTKYRTLDILYIFVYYVHSCA